MIATWMLYCTAVSLLLGLAALALERVLRLYGYATRWAWTAAVLSGPTLLLWSGVVQQPQESLSLADPVAAMPLSLVVSSPSPVLLPAEEVSPLLARIDPLLLSGWAVMSLALLAGLAFSLLRVRRQRHTWRREEVCGIPVLISGDVGPATVGFFRTAVVLPEWVLSWDEDRKHLILAHEQEHIRAGDPRLLLLAIAAAILTPWNPALWWQLRRLRLAVEVDCDARMLCQQVNVRSYGTLLLDVGQWSSISYLPVTAFSQPRSFLERRIRAMAAPRPHRPLRTATLLCSLFALGIGTAASMPAPDRPAFLPTASDRLQAESRKVSTAPEAAVPAPACSDRDLLPHLVCPAPSLGAGITQAEGTPASRTIPPPSAQADTLKPVLQNPDAVQRALVAHYPPLLRDAGVTGTVMLEVATDESGRVRETRAVRTSHQAFGEAARRALAGARFAPARSSGQPVPFRFTIPVRFELPLPDADLPAISTAISSATGRGASDIAADALLGSVTHEPAGIRGVRTIRTQEQALAWTQAELSGVEQERAQILVARGQAIRARGQAIQARGTTLMRTQFDETQALIRRAVESHYPEAFSRGLSRDKYLWFLVGPSGQIEETGVAPVEWERNGWSSTSIRRMLESKFPEIQIQHSHHSAGLQMGTGAKVNAAWITRK